MARTGDPHAKIDLLRAALAVFSERGLEGAKVEDITARAGRSKGSFYLHFDSKDAAFRQLVEGVIARLAAIIDDCVAEPPELPELAAHWLAKDVEIFDFLWQNRGIMRICLAGGGGAGWGFLIDEFAERARANSKALLIRGVEQGYYRDDLDVESASLLIAGAYDRLAREVVKVEARPDLPRMLQQVQSLFIRGIGSPRLLALIDDPPVSQPHPKKRTRSKAS